MGLQDLEEARKHHTEDEEHLYHVERRVKVMCPGLAMCPACSQLIQNPKNWEAHHVSVKHQKCSETLNAIGIPGDYTSPVGASAPGQLSGPIDYKEIDCSTATAVYGYGKPFNITGIPIVGLNFIEPMNNDQSKGARFKCGTCEAQFGFLDRLAHLTSVKHRRFYLKKHYQEWFEIVTQNTPKSREKDKLSFFAYKVEQLEKDSEKHEAKQLRDRFFGLERHLSISISKAKNKEARKSAGLPLKHPRNDRPGDFGRNCDWNRDNMGKFQGLQPFPPAKRYKPGPADFRIDPYTGRGLEMEDLDKRDAMEAINVLERFSLRQAEQEIREKMDKMRDAIMRGARLSEIQGYGAMMSSMTMVGSVPRDRMEMDRPSPPRGGGLLSITNDRTSVHSYPQANNFNRPGPALAGTGSAGPLLQEDALYMAGIDPTARRQ